MIEIKDKRSCCGCSACVQVCPVDCIGWSEDTEGFLYPVADAARCIGCGKCDAVCPMLHPQQTAAPRQILGVINPEMQVRMESSSGGVFTALARQVVAAGGAVFGAGFDDNFTVEHTWAETAEGLRAMCGSKYMQSRMGDCFRQAKTMLDAGRRVLFTGTSCQIAGLRNYLAHDYPNLLAVDVVCHSIPSPKVWRQYLSEIPGGAGSDITAVSFRDKSRGWQDFSVVVSGTGPDGAGTTLLSETTAENAYMRGVLRGLFSRPACARCPAKAFASGADLTIADFWGAGDFYPEKDDNRGISLTFVLSGKGVDALRGLEAEKFPATLAQATAQNPRIMKPAKLHPKRSDFFRGLGDERIDSMVRRLTKRTRVEKIKYKIRKKLGRL